MGGRRQVSRDDVRGLPAEPRVGREVARVARQQPLVVVGPVAAQTGRQRVQRARLDDVVDHRVAPRRARGLGELHERERRAPREQSGQRVPALLADDLQDRHEDVVAERLDRDGVGEVVGQGVDLAVGREHVVGPQPHGPDPRAEARHRRLVDGVGVVAEGAEQVELTLEHRGTRRTACADGDEIGGRDVSEDAVLERAVRLSERRVMRRHLGRDGRHRSTRECGGRDRPRLQLPGPALPSRHRGVPGTELAPTRLLQHVHRFVCDEREAGISGEAGAWGHVDVRTDGQRVGARSPDAATRTLVTVHPHGREVRPHRRLEPTERDVVKWLTAGGCHVRNPYY